MVTQIYKIRSEIWVGPSPPPPRNVAAQKQKFWHDFAQLRDLIVNISRMQQDVVIWKTALQTTDTPVLADLIRCTALVHKRRKTGPEI